MENFPEKPLYIKPIQSNYLRRAKWHDYRNPCIYMITLSLRPGFPKLSDLELECEDPLKVATRLSPPGLACENALRDLQNSIEDIGILQYVIMPDHIHFLIRIKKYYPKGLGFLIRSYKRKVSEIFNSMGNPSLKICSQGGNESRISEKQPLRIFEAGYNDRILSQKGQLDILFQYIRDNPKRLWLRQHRPEYFSGVHTINITGNLKGNVKGNVNGENLQIYGNFLLLRHPFRKVICYSSKDSLEIAINKDRGIDELARSQGVGISPFIHPCEKHWRDKIIESGGKIIEITNVPMPARYSPKGRDFELCLEGRLLIISCAENTLQNLALSREMAMKMNSLAEKILNITPNSPLILSKLKN